MTEVNVKHITTMMLETSNLKIIPLSPARLKLLLGGTPRLEQELGLKPSGLELEEHTHAAMAYLYALAQDTQFAFPWITNWQIVLKAENVSIGSLCFMNTPDESGAVEIGYGLYPKFQRHGYMTEALHCVCAWALEQADVKRVIAESEPENFASHRVLERCGFRPISVTHWCRLRQEELFIEKSDRVSAFCVPPTTDFS